MLPARLIDGIDGSMHCYWIYDISEKICVYILYHMTPLLLLLIILLLFFL